MNDSQDSGMQRRVGRRPGIFGKKRVPVRYLAPNLLTLLALCAGVTSIRAAIEGRYELGVALVVVAALLDGLDGRVARAFNAQSRFGAELDSLADFVSFGVAPAILVFMWSLGPLPGLGWIAVLIYACAAGLRLARFNAALEEDRPKWQSEYFTGVPAPAGAILVMLPLYLDGTGLLPIRQWPLVISIYVLITAGLLVSTLPTFSGKLLGERIAREYVAPALVAGALAVALLVTYPHVTLSVMSLVYLGTIPLGIRRFGMRRRAWEASRAMAGQDKPAAPGGLDAALPRQGQPGQLPYVPPGDTRH
jgi:CDP-diacylglycerol--serine O-phosphatidyltransferase